MIKQRATFIFLLLFFVFSDSYSSQPDTIRLYYHIDQNGLADKTSTLDSLVSTLDKKVQKISVIGYADYLGSYDHNIRLSRARADMVKEYLRRNVFYIPIESIGKGEVPSLIYETLAGNPVNRRVDIIVLRQALAINTSTEIQIQSSPTIHKRLDRQEGVLPKTKGYLPDSSAETQSVRSANKPLIQQKDTISKETKSPTDPVQRILSLSNLKPGENISLEELTFQPGRHFLRPEALPYMAILLKTLKKNRNLKIEIQGHICCDYDNQDGYDLDEANHFLSVNRAKFIYDYLSKQGISVERMTYKGFGSSKPKVFPEVTAADQIQNRRVVIAVIENK